MPPHNPYEIPDDVTNDAELKAWYDRELEKLGDELAPGTELELLRSANRFYCKLKTESNLQLDKNNPNPYKGLLVSALMEGGWDLKRGSQKSKTLRPDAIETFKKALRLIQENPKACYRLGHLLKSRGEFGEAIGYFSRALELASKQADFREELKLSSAQIANAGGQAVALTQELIGGYDFDVKPTFDPEQVATLQNLLQQTWYSHVVYLTKVGESILPKTLDSNYYDDLIRDLIKDQKALVIDKYDRPASIRYLDKHKSYEYNSPRSGKLNYLLKALDLEDWEIPSDTHDTIAQNIHRVNEDLQKIGVAHQVEIKYSREDGGRIFCPKCDLSVHYFKSLLD